MPTQVVIDIIEGVRWLEKDGQAAEVSRSAIVSGLDPSFAGSFIGPGGNDAIVARAATAPGMPQPGDRHPALNLYLKDRTFTALGPTIIQAELTYRRLDANQPPIAPGLDYAVRGGTQTEQIETETDRDNQQITLEHNGVTQGGVANVDAARSVLEIEQTFQSSTPGQHTRAWTNKVNGDGWQGDAAGTWRILNVTFDLVDPNTRPHPTWKFVYSFSNKPTGWQPKVVYIDPETGRPPADLVANVGFKTIDWYEEAAFLTLFPA